MAKKGREIEVFGLSFMDLISCGLGGVIVLMLIFSTLVKGGDSQQGVEGKQESDEEAIARQEQRSICHFYLEVDLVSDSKEEQVYLRLKEEPGVIVDSLQVSEPIESLKYLKRYIIAYSIPGKVSTGEFNFLLDGNTDKDYEARVRLITNKADLESFEFSGDRSFSVKKIARNYSLRI